MVYQKKICIILALLAKLGSVLTTDKKNYPQVYLEECKYKVKKVQMSRFINTELKSDSESDSDSDLDSNLKNIKTKVDSELESDSDNDSGYDSGYDTIH